MYLLNSVSIHAVELVLGTLNMRNPLLVFPLTLGVAMAAAFVSYRYFESRFLQLKTRFSRLRPDPTAGAPDAIAGAEAGVSVHP